jgi:hypothetical protein
MFWPKESNPSLHVVNAEEQEAQAGQHVTGALETFSPLEDQDDAEYQHRHGIVRQVHLQAEACHQPSAGGRTQAGAEDDADAGSQLQQAGAEERDGDDRDERARLQDRGRYEPEGHALRDAVGGRFRYLLEGAGSEGLEAFFQRKHAEQEDRHTRGNGLELRADREAVSKEQEDRRQEGLT